MPPPGAAPVGGQLTVRGRGREPARTDVGRGDVTGSGREGLHVRLPALAVTAQPGDTALGQPVGSVPQPFGHGPVEAPHDGGGPSVGQDRSRFLSADT